MKQLTIQAIYRALQLALFYVAALVVALLVDVAAGHAQQPAAPSAAPPAASEGANGQDDQEWLTAYMLAHEGYRLHHVDALNDSFSKMTPSQLSTMRDLYEQKHQQMVQQQQLFHRMNALQVSMAEHQNARQQQMMSQINQEQSQAAGLEERQLNQMHMQAAEAAAQKSMTYPSYMQPMGYPYSPYGYGRPNLYHPYPAYPY